MAHKNGSIRGRFLQPHILSFNNKPTLQSLSFSLSVLEKLEQVELLHTCCGSIDRSYKVKYKKHSFIFKVEKNATTSKEKIQFYT